MSAALQTPNKMALSDFMAWLPPRDLTYELIEGVVQAMAPSSRTHAAIQSQTAHLLASSFERGGSTCSALTEAGVTMALTTVDNVRIPDVVVTCTAPSEEEERLIAEPKVIIEVLSPSNASATWTNVWAYIAIPSLQEILILQSDCVRAHLLRRQEDGSWPLATKEVIGQVDLLSIDFSVPLTDFYRTSRLAPRPGRTI